MHHMLRIVTTNERRFRLLQPVWVTRLTATNRASTQQCDHSDRTNFSLPDILTTQQGGGKGARHTHLPHVMNARLVLSDRAAPIFIYGWMFVGCWALLLVAPLDSTLPCLVSK